MRHYCTLSDKTYLAKLVVMYESLRRHSSEPFMLHVLALDDETRDAMWACEQVQVWKIKDVENALNLQRVRETRTYPEWCWTLASVFTDYLLSGFKYEEMTYLDADLMFFSDPKVIFAEIGNRSIGIIPHRLIPSKKYLEATSGTYNVGLVYFSKNGADCLRVWSQQCRNRCLSSDGGDQKYLNDWPAKYDVCVIQNPGVGLAPWNLANYLLSSGPKVDNWPVVFFHAHEFKKLEDGTFRLTNYELRKEDKELIYAPYLKAYIEAEEKIAPVHLQS